MVLLILGLYFAGCPMYFTGMHKVLPAVLKVNTGIVRAMGVAMLMFVLLGAPEVQRVLSHPLLLWFGEISFEVYAFHWPLMLSFQAWVFYCLQGRVSYDAAAIASFLAVLPVIYLTAHLVHRLMEKWNLLVKRYRIKL